LPDVWVKPPVFSDIGTYWTALRGLPRSCAKGREPMDKKANEEMKNSAPFGGAPLFPLRFRP
jgi:hypothetical protein